MRYFFAFPSAFFFAAHRCRILSAAAARCAAVNLRRPFFAGSGPALSVAGAAAESIIASGFFGGRPRRFVGPWRASMARLSLSPSRQTAPALCPRSRVPAKTRIAQPTRTTFRGGAAGFIHPDPDASYYASLPAK